MGATCSISATRHSLSIAFRISCLLRVIRSLPPRITLTQPRDPVSARGRIRQLRPGSNCYNFETLSGSVRTCFSTWEPFPASVIGQHPIGRICKTTSVKAALT